MLSPDSHSIVLLVASLAVPYALVLASPGPNLLVMLRVSFASPISGTLAAALGISCGATLAATIGYQGSLLVVWADRLQEPFAILLAAILVRSAIRMMRLNNASRGGVQTEKALRMSKAFGLGIVSSLSNPMTVPFFLSFFLAHQTLRPFAWLAPAVVFVMAAIWFSCVGIALGKISTMQVSSATRLYARLAISISMIAYATHIIYTLV